MVDLQKGVRGVYQQGAFREMCSFVAYDHTGKLRLVVQMEEEDVDENTIPAMQAWLDRKDSISLPQQDRLQSSLSASA
jgi:hypothetical protein